MLAHCKHAVVSATNFILTDEWGYGQKPPHIPARDLFKLVQDTVKAYLVQVHGSNDMLDEFG